MFILSYLKRKGYKNVLYIGKNMKDIIKYRTIKKDGILGTAYFLVVFGFMLMAIFPLCYLDGLGISLLLFGAFFVLVAIDVFKMCDKIISFEEEGVFISNRDYRKCTFRRWDEFKYVYQVYHNHGKHEHEYADYSFSVFYVITTHKLEEKNAKKVMKLIYHWQIVHDDRIYIRVRHKHSLEIIGQLLQEKIGEIDTTYLDEGYERSLLKSKYLIEK